MTKVVFLDRDGPINVDHGYVYKIEDWQWAGGAIDGMKLLQQAGYKLAIITNQSGIGQGLYPVEDMHRLHDFMKAQLSKHGITIDAIAFCPHARDGDCDCRKPKTGMAKQIEANIGQLDYAASWTVGDKEADVGFGATLGTKTALVRSDYWQAKQLTTTPTIIVASLLEAAQYIVK
jgi:D-glycero-D-manno-heptose 1,7-bisphosphate phosphatase